MVSAADFCSIVAAAAKAALRDPKTFEESLAGSVKDLHQLLAVVTGVYTQSPLSEPTQKETS